jgi:hypothetical protein
MHSSRLSRRRLPLIIPQTCAHPPSKMKLVPATTLPPQLVYNSRNTSPSLLSPPGPPRCHPLHLQALLPIDDLAFTLRNQTVPLGPPPRTSRCPNRTWVYRLTCTTSIKLDPVRQAQYDISNYRRSCRSNADFAPPSCMRCHEHTFAGLDNLQQLIIALDLPGERPAVSM